VLSKRCSIEEQSIEYVVRGDIITPCTTHNILSTAPQLSISQKALGTLPEDGNVMATHVGDIIHN
jgi:hypothetical protein